MPITVLSPFSGRPVKVRDQDVSRAIRDEEGRIFYVVERSDGKGYYAAPTRKGSEKDEQRYLELQAKTSAVAASVKDAGGKAAMPLAHDATGRGNDSGIRKFILLLLLLLCASVVAWVIYVFGDQLTGGGTGSPTTPALPAPSELPQPEVEPGAALPADITQARAPSAAPVPNSARQAQTPHSTIHKVASIQAMTQSQSQPAEGFSVTAAGLRYRIETIGEGPPAEAGKYVLIHYTAKQIDGKTIASTRKGEPAGFVLWSGQASKLWDQAIAAMRVGGKRSFILPSHDVPTPSLPASQLASKLAAQDSDLRFDVELLDVKPGVTWTTTEQGNGIVVRPGDRVRVHYTGYINDEAEPFDDTHATNTPMTFTLGAGDVIPGWELGMVAMREGETRTLTIPPYLAYGKRGAGGIIPPSATLRFDLTLLEVLPPVPEQISG